VTVVHRNKNFRARREFVDQLKTNHCITLFTDAKVTRILGNESVEAVEIQRKDALKPFQMAVRGVLVRIGVEPNTAFVQGQLEINEQGYIAVTNEQETSVPNVFAIGDVSNPLAPTLSGAAGDGATAAKVIAHRLTGKSTR
jgi:thioredoxin reductase (NADPH)